MSAITKEWLQSQISAIKAVGITESNTLQAFEIALASLEAETVAYIIKDKTDRKEGHRGELSFRSVEQYYEEDINEHELMATPLYSAPPAPVSVPDEDLLHMAASAIEDLLSNKDRSGAGVWADIPAKLRRAAMLQGAEPVTTDYKLPFDQWLSQQTGTIDVECGCVMTEVFFHWLRVAYEAGNSPVTPDGWQLVPKEPTEAMNKAGWSAMNEHDAINPTYRAMLEAAPQQEVKNG